MTWLAVRALLAKVPAIAWVIAFVALFLAVASFALYHHGESVGETRVHRIALADSATKAHTLVRIAQAETDRRRAAASLADRIADSGRVKRRALRADVEPLLLDLPAPVVALIQADDRQMARDSVAHIARAAADSAWQVERDRRIDADSVESHQITLGAAPQAHHGRTVAVVGAVAVVAVAVVKYGPAILSALLHR